MDSREELLNRFEYAKNIIEMAEQYMQQRGTLIRAQGENDEYVQYLPYEEHKPQKKLWTGMFGGKRGFFLFIVFLFIMDNKAGYPIAVILTITGLHRLGIAFAQIVCFFATIILAFIALHIVMKLVNNSRRATNAKIDKENEAIDRKNEEIYEKNKLIDIENKQRLSKIRERDERLAEQITAIENKIIEFRNLYMQNVANWYPPDYHFNKDALACFIRYVANYQALSIGECVNLYEQELRNRRYEQIEKEKNQQMRIANLIGLGSLCMQNDRNRMLHNIGDSLEEHNRSFHDFNNIINKW